MSAPSPLSAPAAVLVEGIGRKRHFLAHPAPQKVANRLADRAADQIKAGGFNCGIGAWAGVEGVFTGDQIGLRTLQAAAPAFDHV